MRATPEGQEYADEWYIKKWETVGLVDVASDRSLKRQLLMMWKMAALLALSYGEAPAISAERFDEARLILALENRSIERLLNLADEKPDAGLYDRMLKFVEINGGCATQTELTNRFHRTTDRKQRKEVLDTLGELGKLRGGGHGVSYFLPDHKECDKCAPKLKPIKVGGTSIRRPR